MRVEQRACRTARTERPSPHRRELRKSDLEATGIWTLIASTTLQDFCPVEPLQSIAQPGAVDFVEQPTSDVNDSPRIDPEQIAVVREMVDGAQCDAVGDRCQTGWIAIVHNVRRLKQRCLTELAHRAPNGVGA